MTLLTHAWFGHIERKLFLLFIFLVVTSVKSDDADKPRVKVTIRNELTQDVMVHWETGQEDERHEVGLTKSHGGESTIESFGGHVFSYITGNERHFFEVPAEGDNHYVVLNANKQEILVRCSTTARGGDDDERILDIFVFPQWSPRGASRFLELVRQKHFDGVAVHRVVNGFLTQFGIPSDPGARDKIRDLVIRDDPNVGIKFEPGIVSFAGSGPDSRTSEIFIVAPDNDNLSSFGEEPWETPFGFVVDVKESVVSEWYEYGDMPPEGSGPDPQKIYLENGYEYLAENFPKLDYINECVVMKDFTDEL